ncbi:hypothetical protein C8R47DRAFT_1218509 [Mycena vitilis]|nr:hypothetical protein C8R47DRAFT_1218509 [Mycena vitilis]
MATAPPAPSGLDADPSAYLALPRFNHSLDFHFLPPGAASPTPATVTYALTAAPPDAGAAWPLIVFFNGLGGHRLIAALLEGIAPCAHPHARPRDAMMVRGIREARGAMGQEALLCLHGGDSVDVSSFFLPPSSVPPSASSAASAVVASAPSPSPSSSPSAPASAIVAPDECDAIDSIWALGPGPTPSSPADILHTAFTRLADLCRMLGRVGRGGGGGRVGGVGRWVVENVYGRASAILFLAGVGALAVSISDPACRPAQLGRPLGAIAVSPPSTSSLPFLFFSSVLRAGAMTRATRCLARPAIAHPARLAPTPQTLRARPAFLHASRAATAPTPPVGRHRARAVLRTPDCLSTDLFLSRISSSYIAVYSSRRRA